MEVADGVVVGEERLRSFCDEHGICRLRLRHRREAAEKAIAFSSGRTRESLDDDELLRLGLTKVVEIVGEAAKQISEPTRTRCPAVPWSAAARMRDRLIHHYFDIDLDILWADRDPGPPRAGRSVAERR